MQRTASALVCLLLLPACAAAPAPRTAAATSAEEARALAAGLYAAWSDRAPERIDALLTEDVVYEDVAAGRVLHGREEVKRLMRTAFAFAPDFRVTLRSLTVAGDAAAAEWLIEAARAEPPGGEEPKRLELRGASVLAFREGRIARVTDYYDMATILRHLGVPLPAPPPL